MKNNNYETSFKERLSYYIFFTGQNINYMFVVIFLSIYSTSVLGLSAATVSIILLSARVWDAINDPIISILIERSRNAKGKFKPWVNIVSWAVPLSMTIIFMFGDTIAELPMWARITYSCVTYVLWGMLYTVSDAPAYALGTVMTKNLEERNVLYSFVRMGGFFGMLICMAGAPILVEKLDGQWSYAAIILGIVSFIFMVPIRMVKERHVEHQEVPSLSDIAKGVLGNRYLLIFMFTVVLILGANFAFTLAPFIGRDVFNDPSLSSLILFSIIGPAMLAAPAVPFAISKIGKRNTFAGAMAVTVIMSYITWVVGYEHFTTFIILNMIKAFAMGIMFIMPNIFVADCIEYGHRKTGVRLEAVSFAAQTFTNKTSSAFCGAIAMGYLAMVGFIETTGGKTVQQPMSVIEGMWDVLNLGNAIGVFIGLVVFLMGYRLTLEAETEPQDAIDVRPVATD